MRHFFSSRPFPATCPITSLAFGVTVPTAPSLLVTVSGRAQRLTPGDTGTCRAAVLLAAVTMRADPHLVLTPGAQEQSGIVHRSPRRGELDDPAAYSDTGYGAARECGSGRSPGRDRQVFEVRGCVSLFAALDLTRVRARRHLWASRVHTSRRLTSSQGRNQTQPEEFEAKQGTSARNGARHRRIVMTRMFAKYAQVSVAAYRWWRRGSSRPDSAANFP